MTKIRSYTIMELIVVMTISLIVVSITYKSLEIVQHQYLKYYQTQEHLREMNQLDFLLTRDFNKCVYVRRTTEGLICYFKDEHIAYSFEENFIVRRKQASIDTFFLKSQNQRYLFSRQEAKPPSTYIDYFEFSLGKEASNFQYTKVYGADVLLASQLNTKQ